MLECCSVHSVAAVHNFSTSFLSHTGDGVFAIRRFVQPSRMFSTLTEVSVTVPGPIVFAPLLSCRHCMPYFSWASAQSSDDTFISSAFPSKSSVDLVFHPKLWTPIGRPMKSSFESGRYTMAAVEREKPKAVYSTAIPQYGPETIHTVVCTSAVMVVTILYYPLWQPSYDQCVPYGMVWYHHTTWVYPCSGNN